MKLKLGLVLVVVIALLGVWYFAPNVLQGIGDNECRMNLTYGAPPLGAPDDITMRAWVDGVEVDWDGSFTVAVGSSHSIHYTVYYPSGLIYADFARMFNAPSEPGNYDLLLDGLGNLTVVAT